MATPRRADRVIRVIRDSHEFPIVRAPLIPGRRVRIFIPYLVEPKPGDVLSIKILIVGCLLLLLYAVRRYRRRGEVTRERMEDALKFLADAASAGEKVRPESLAGRLKLSYDATAGLLQKMVERGLVRMSRGGIVLTAEGRALGIQVLRAHRLWERYLADDTGAELQEIHRMAERKEHRLSGAEIQSLEARLGYPDRDPHGDPIPAGTDAVAEEAGTPLTDWPVGAPASVIHIEDEPESICTQILAAGILPGSLLAVRERTATAIRVDVDGEAIWLPPVVTANIFVTEVAGERSAGDGAVPLSRVGMGCPARVVRVSAEIRGLARRRILDLGFTRGARVEAILRSSFGGGDPVAYRVRGTVIALRREQAEQIFVSSLEEVAADAG